MRARDEDELIVGRGRLVGPHRLLVDDDFEVKFKQLVVATGSIGFEYLSNSNKRLGEPPFLQSAVSLLSRIRDPTSELPSGDQL